MARWTLLPPAPDACQVCAGRHAPEEPHNPQSLYWATARSMQGLPSPTWEDALEHVDDGMHAHWRAALGERGVVIRPR